MISKHVPLRSGRNSSFAALARYISSAHGKEERVGTIRLTNLPEIEIGDAVALVVATQRANDRAKADRTYHLLLSFPAGEVPSPEVLAQIEERMCAAIGFGAHQRISAVHHDTDNVHVHIAINKIHPTKLTIHHPSFDKRTLGETARSLEGEFGLAATNHEPRGSVGQGKAADMARAGGLEPLLDYVKRTCPNLATAATWEEMYAQLAEYGLAIKPQGAGLAIVEPGGQGIKASSISRSLSKGKLEERLGPFAPPTATMPIAKETYKAGPAPARPERAQRVDTRALYARYEAERDKARSQRSASFEAARTRRTDAMAAAVSARGNQKLIGGLLPGKGVRQTVRSTQTSLHRLAVARLKAAHGREVAAIKARFPAQPGWLEWLQKEAMAGNGQALAALRERAAQPQTVTPQPSSVKGYPGLDSSALSIAPGAADRADSITKSGTVIWRDRDATVRDDGSRLHVSRGSQDAGIVAALRIARDRHGGALSVGGDADFMMRVARLAALHDPTIRFADAAIERARTSYVRQIEEKTDGPQTGGLPGREAGRQFHQNGPGSDARSARHGAGRAGGGRSSSARRGNTGRASPARAAERTGPTPRDAAGVRSDRTPAQLARTALAILRGGLSELGRRGDRQREDPSERLRLHELPRSRLAHGPGQLGMLLPGDEDRNLVNRPAPNDRGLHSQGAGSAGASGRDHGGGRARGAVETPRPASPVPLPASKTEASAPMDAPVPQRPSAVAPIEQAIRDADARDNYIGERNTKRAAGMYDILPHERFAPGAPSLTYAGLRRIDFTNLGLFQTESRIMVLPLSREVADRVSKLKVGTKVDQTTIWQESTRTPSRPNLRSRDDQEEPRSRDRGRDKDRERDDYSR